MWVLLLQSLHDGSNNFQVTKRIDGYPRFAAYLASAPNFHVGRDYKEARIRVRLHKMYIVETKQAELEALDQKQSRVDEYSVCSIAEDIKYFKSERHKLIGELDVALRELGEWTIDGVVSNPAVANGRRRDPAPRGSVQRAATPLQVR